MNKTTPKCAAPQASPASPRQKADRMIHNPSDEPATHEEGQTAVAAVPKAFDRIVATREKNPLLNL